MNNLTNRHIFSNDTEMAIIKGINIENRCWLNHCMNVSLHNTFSDHARLMFVNKTTYTTHTLIFLQTRRGVEAKSGVELLVRRCNFTFCGSQVTSYLESPLEGYKLFSRWFVVKPFNLNVNLAFRHISLKEENKGPCW